MKGRNRDKVRTAVAAVLFLLAGLLPLVAGPDGGHWILSLLFFACAAWWALSLFDLKSRRRERHEGPS